MTPETLLVPYVSTTLHTLWLPADVPTLGYVWVAGGLGDQGGQGGQGQRPVVHYRVTCEVYAWLRRQLAIADDKTAAAVKEEKAGTPGDRDALFTDVQALVEQLRAIAERWNPVADWAEATYSAEDRAKAEGNARLPSLAVRWEMIPECGGGGGGVGKGKAKTAAKAVA